MISRLHTRGAAFPEYGVGVGPCPSCGAGSRDGARFCDSCGGPLTGAESQRKERKFAAALFADIVGSTSLGERHDPEVIEELIGHALDQLSSKVAHYGGSVEGRMGDGLFAVFGIPVAHEDDCDRAVRAALEMHATVSQLNRQPGLQHRPDLQIRIGIDAGEILIGDPDVGGRRRVLTGDAINTAARLQGTAPPGGVVVGSAVHEATATAVSYEELPPLSLKGKSEPTSAWLAQTIAARTGGERLPAAFGTELIGRSQEMAILTRTLSRAETESRPALATILGDAGVGKSRLAWEIRRFIDESETTFYWRRGRAQPYGAEPYSAMADAVKAHCEILDDDPGPTVTEKVERAVSDLFGSSEVTPEILALVTGGGADNLSRERLFDAWRRFLERLSARYPLVLVFEDIHWADDGLLDLIEYLADWALGPIFILTMARPELLERRQTWGGGRRNYAAIYLDPLGPAENEAMVSSLLKGSVPDEVERAIVERSEGNPLFTEEIVRMLIDQGLLEQRGDTWVADPAVEEVVIPRSIQGLLSARLDTLTPQEKAALQDASVVGRNYWLGAVAALSDGARDEAKIMSQLRLKELIIPREPARISGELEFSFRHALIRDVTYDSLARRDRARKHTRVAVWAQGAAPDSTELIATHYELALGELEALDDTGPERRALETEVYDWSVRAGQRAANLWQHDGSARWFSRSIELFDSVDAPLLQRAEILDAYALATLGTATYEATERAHEAALLAFEALGMAAEAGRIEARIAQIAFESARDDVIPRVEKAITRLEPLGASEALAGVLHVLGWYHWRRGSYDTAEPLLRRAAEMSRQTSASVVLGQALQTLGVMLVDRGDWHEGLELMEESYSVAKSAGNLDLLLRVCHNLPNVLAHYAPSARVGGQAGSDRATEILMEGLELARRSGNRRWESGLLGIAAWHLKNAGELGEAERFAEESLASARSIGADSLIGEHLLDVALIQIDRGNALDAETSYLEAAAILSKHPEPGNEVWVAVAGAAIERAKGNLEACVSILQSALDALGDNLPVYGGEWLVHDAVRAEVAIGRSEAAQRLLATREHLFKGRPISEAALAWSAGLATDDPDRAVEHLEAAADAFETYGWRVCRGRCLVDQGELLNRIGRDGSAQLNEGWKSLTECGVVTAPTT